MSSNELPDNSNRNGNIYNTNQQLLDEEEVLSESSALLETSKMERQQPSQSFDVSSHSEAYDIGAASQQRRTSPVESFERAPSADMRPALSMESNSSARLGTVVSLPQEQQEEQQGPDNIVQIASEPQMRTQPSSSLPLDLQNTLSSTDETDYPTINSTLNRPIQSIRSARSQTPHRDRTISQQDGQRLQRYYNERANRIFSEDNTRDEENAQPFVEVSNQVLNVRKNALSVYDPLTYTWLIFSPGISITLFLAMAKWTGLLQNFSTILILLPCFLSHLALLFLHIYSIKNLTSFIAKANNNRMKPDSTDHIDRTEYLPLLQRSLKFGIKTGVISFLFFIFEILLLCKEQYGKISLKLVFLPIWIITLGGMTDGFICKSQHLSSVIGWVVLFVWLIMLVIKIDHADSVLAQEMEWRTMLIPLGVLVAMCSGVLLHVVHGHHIGYYRLTSTQYMAGWLYFLTNVSHLTLVWIFLSNASISASSFESGQRALINILTPCSVMFMSLAAYFISRDEFERLLQFGGQADVQPKTLNLESDGWNVVESKGVTWVPMFGEIKFEPLNTRRRSRWVELCGYCYPSSDHIEDEFGYNDGMYIGPHNGSMRRLS